MKIVAGLGSLECFDAYAEAGADEVFCGFAPFEWLEKYGVMAPVNRREALLYPVQIASMTDMRLLARRCAQTGIPASVAVNSVGYPPSLYPALIRLLRALADLGFERFILAEPALILRAREEKLHIQIHLSGEFGEYSRPALRMLGGELISRLIFHRKVTPEEMAACAREMPGREYEAFVLNERCIYTGAMCASLHADELPPLCRVPGKIADVRETNKASFGGCLPSNAERFAEDRERIQASLGGLLPSQVEKTTAERAPVCDEEALGAGGCGICALDVLERAGITHLKLVGRGNRPERMVRDIRALRKALADRSKAKETLFPDGCPGTCYYEP